MFLLLRLSLLLLLLLLRRSLVPRIPLRVLLLLLLPRMFLLRRRLRLLLVRFSCLLLPLAGKLDMGWASQWGVYERSPVPPWMDKIIEHF